MPRNALSNPRFKKTLLALAAGAVLAPHGAWALDLAQSPPSTSNPYVAPNVIISVDDSGSMDWQVTNGNTGNANIVAPNPDGTWPSTAKRINILKYSLNKVFNDTALLPDKKIRVAWQSLWNNGGSPGALNVNSTAMNQNSMRPLQGTQRTNFTTFVSNLVASNNTPSHLMFSQADAYMRQPLGANSPWAADPGTTGAPFLGCRRNYHIMMTDGRWNTNTPTGGAQDNRTTPPASPTLPNGTLYGGVDANKSRLYRDTANNTLADWAFYSWADPLQPQASLTGTVQPANDYRTAPATEDFATPASPAPAVLERFWNPRYDPATWPHMVTYTIGFSTDATTWPGAPTIDAPPIAERVPFSYKGSFPDLVTGARTWPAMDNENKRALDLWHAALNGRGRFYAVNRGDDLEKAFREIIGSINATNEPIAGTNAATGSNNTRTDVGLFVTGYDPLKNWKGSVSASTAKTDGTIDFPWGTKNTADLLDDAAFNVTSRLVLSFSDKWNINTYKGGVPFKWAADDSNLSTPQKVWLQKNTAGVDELAAKGQNRLNYIRGDRSLEGKDAIGYPPATPFRERMSRQGDIINSTVWYVGAPAGTSGLKGYTEFVRSNSSRMPMIYVGGNDGMLHGFSAADGSEKIAYVPKGVIPSLNFLSTPGYNSTHKYFVDGSPMTGDVDLGVGVQDPADPLYVPGYQPDWRTLLVGTLGAGGKGYFALDVTNPNAANFTPPVSVVNPVPASLPGFNESNAQQLVKLDRTRNANEPAPNCTPTPALTLAEETACLKAKDEDLDIGYITAQPVLDGGNPPKTTQITRMNNNRWAVVMGNGYNSANSRPVLLIQYLDGNKELLRIPTAALGTPNAIDNGLAAPRLVDLNGDGRPDVAYAGDNLGNMWKFDLTNDQPANWAVAFSGSPLYTATGPASLASSSRSKIQPITAPPTVLANDRTTTTSTPTPKTSAVGGMMVAFGTGRNIDQNDPQNVDVQTLYSVLDNTRYRPLSTPKGKRLEVHPGQVCSGPPTTPPCLPAPVPATVGSGVTLLAAQSVGAEQAGNGVNANRNFSLISGTAVDWNTQKGWYLDLPAVGERLLKPMSFYDGSNLLAMYSQVPAKGSAADPNIESCTSTPVSERQFQTLLNIMDGKRPSVQLMDLNGDGFYSAAANKDQGVSRVSLPPGWIEPIKNGKTIQIKGSEKGQNVTMNQASMPEQSMRPSWRQLR